MKEPRKFPAVLSGVMLFLMGTFDVLMCQMLWLIRPTVLFCGAGVMSYLTFGSDVKTVVIVNLDTTSKFTQAVQSLLSAVGPSASECIHDPFMSASAVESFLFSKRLDTMALPALMHSAGVLQARLR